jgi:hypothetical protein
MALAQPPFSVMQVQGLFHFLDSAKTKFEHLTMGMLNGVRAFSKVNPVLASIANLCALHGCRVYLVGCNVFLGFGSGDLCLGGRHRCD